MTNDESAKPVAWVEAASDRMRGKDLNWFAADLSDLPVGTKLYAHPDPVASKEAATLSDEDVETPWSDCKVAYGVDNDEALWAAYEGGTLKLPHGWKLNETDASGARCVAIFRVEGNLNRESGDSMRAEIERIDRLAQRDAGKAEDC